MSTRVAEVFGSCEIERRVLCGALSFVARARKWFPDPRREGRQKDFLVRSPLLFHATFREIQSYEDLHLNTYLWRLLGSLFQLPTIALFAQNAVHARANLPARRWIR